ncbi:hypothetical protein TrVE_jg642 [Triparma verrucosa]|uniref:Uncharacterized protein n=1 Tax=Triparma verrucosa TaxID=1606542 RepID=A0A9W7KYC6_9STRA|nr:hypothetical protein TrVE_jg642 [Triparma verrucosa]
MSSPDLSLPTTWTEGVQDQQSPVAVIPGPPLSDPLGPCLSSLLKVRVYAPLLQTLETEYGPPILAQGPEEVLAHTPFYVFTYDWRRSNNETVALLHGFLEKLHTPPQVIAHSNGGLLLFSCLNKNPALVHSAIYAAVPFKGNLTFLPDLTQGKKIGLNKKILSAAVQRTFSLPYHILPYRSEAAGLFLNSHGEEIRVDWHDIKTWTDHGLVEPDGAEAMHVKEALSDAVLFKSSLIPSQPKDSYPKSIVVAGNAVPTADGVTLTKPGTVSMETFEKKPGDGRFTESCVQPPTGTVVKTLISTHKHDSVLDGVDVIAALETLRKVNNVPDIDTSEVVLEIKEE